MGRDSAYLAFLLLNRRPIGAMLACSRERGSCDALLCGSFGNDVRALVGRLWRRSAGGSLGRGGGADGSARAARHGHKREKRIRLGERLLAVGWRPVGVD